MSVRVINAPDFILIFANIIICLQPVSRPVETFANCVRFCVIVSPSQLKIIIPQAGVNNLAAGWMALSDKLDGFAVDPYFW